MAFYLERQETTSTPYVMIDEAQGYMMMEGRCFHENTSEFFSEIDGWLDGYLLTGFKTFTFDCSLSYFNSSTLKALLNLILKMDKYASSEKKVIINWIALKNNEIVVECGEDFKEEVSNLTFNILIKEKIKR